MFLKQTMSFLAESSHWGIPNQEKHKITENSSSNQKKEFPMGNPR